MSEYHLLALAGLIVLGVAAQWVAWRLRIASILLLLLLGFAVGPLSALLLGEPLLDTERLLGDLLMPFVSLSVALILYEGGLSLRLAELREARAAVWRLVTVGAIVTWGLAAAAAALVLDVQVPVAVLLGAVLVVTGPTVILPLLRQIRPSGRIGAILKWEGIVIDPVGAMLAVLVFEVILLGSLEGAASFVAMALLRTVGVGVGFGLAAGLALALILRWFWVPDFLENAVSIMFVIGVYTGAQHLQSESGLFAAAIMGVTLANQRFVDVRHIVEFKENLRVLLLSSLFILLAARLQMDELERIGWGAALFLLLLVLVIRPLSVLVSTAGLGLKRRELAFLAVMAPRGIVAAAVASVFALRLQDAETSLESIDQLVPMTFLAIIGTVIFASMVAAPVAHRLGVADPEPQGILFVGAHAWGRVIAEAVQKQGFRVLLVDTNRADIAAARLAGLRTHPDSILAEHLLDQIDLGGIGRLIAGTPNDWVNILAVQRFARVFGRGEVYQIPPRKRGDAGEAHRHLHGRWLFSEDLTYPDLARRVDRGAVVKPTPITEEFTYESFRRLYGEHAVPLFMVTAAGRLQVLTAGQPVEPKAGDTLISLVDAEAAEAAAEERAEVEQASSAESQQEPLEPSA